MKLLFFLGILYLSGTIPANGFFQQDVIDQDTSIATPPEDYLFYDNQIQINDSLGNYREAINTAKKALQLARENQDREREWGYHLKLAKYHYLAGRTDDALRHFRLYALVKASQTEYEKNIEMLELEEAYLDEIDAFMMEMNMDKTLIRNLQAENERYYQSQQTIKLAIKIAGGILLLVIIIVLYNRLRLKKDKEATARQEKDDLQRFKDQVEKLDLELKKNNEEITMLKEAQHQNLVYARNMQLSLLPSGLKLPEKIPNSFILHLPRDIISGDFYAIHSIGDKTVLSVFDCPGHGVNAAQSTVVSHNLFKEIVSQGITAPSMILTMMDQKLKHEIQRLNPRKEMISGVKMAVCTINNKTKEVEYAGAHFPLFYVHLDELHFVRGNRFPVGDPLFSDKFYSSNNLRLSNDDMIYLSSDGYYSQLGGKKNKKFLRVSLINLFKTIYKQELKEQEFVLEKVFQEWKSRNEQTDDVLVLGLKL